MKQTIIALLVLAIPLTAVEPAYKTLEAFHLSLQTADMIITIKGLKMGLTEGNPIIRPFAKSMPVMIAFKAGATFGELWMFRKVYKHSKLGAYISLIAANIFMSYIVFRNVRILHQY